MLKRDQPIHTPVKLPCGCSKLQFVYIISLFIHVHRLSLQIALELVDADLRKSNLDILRPHRSSVHFMETHGPIFSWPNPPTRIGHQNMGL